MKNKLILIMFFCLITLLSNAQSGNQKQIEPAKSLTIEEVNRVSGIPNPMINGIPYNQYKAQQDALKQQKASEAAKRQLASTVYTEKTMTISETPVKPVAPAATKKVDEREVTKTVSEIVKPAAATIISPDVAITSSNKAVPPTVAPVTVSDKIVTPTQEDKSVYQQAKRTTTKSEAVESVIAAPVKEKPVVTQPATTPLNLNSSSVRGVTEVPVVEKPVKKD